MLAALGRAFLRRRRRRSSAPSSTYKVAPLATTRTVVTDTGLSPDWRQRLGELGIDAMIVEPGGEAA